MQFVGQHVPWNFTIGAETLVLQVLQFQKIGACHEFPCQAGISYY